MAPPSMRDSAVSPCFHGCPAFLHGHFPPQSPPPRPLNLSLRSQKQPSPGIPPQSLNSSSQPLCGLGYVWLQQGLSDSHSSSVQFSHSVIFDSLQPHRLQHTRHPCPSPTPGVYTNSSKEPLNAEQILQNNFWMLAEDPRHQERQPIVFEKRSVQFSRSVVYDSLRPHESQHTRHPCPSPTPGVHSNSRPRGLEVVKSIEKDDSAQKEWRKKRGGWSSPL